MKNIHTSVLLLQALVRLSKREEEVTLAKALAFFDYANHSLPSYHEWSNSLQLAISLGWIEMRDGNLILSSDLRVWKESLSSNLSLQQERKEIADYLAIQSDKEEIMVASLVSEEEFNAAVKAYLNKQEE